VVGEMFVGGAGVARGYLNRPALNAERFLADPFQPDARLYKSGDLARRLPDGSFEYLGRNAAQSLFAAGEEPAAFLAITLHTLELAAPAAATWDLPVTMFSVLPQKATEAFDKAANLRTEEAAAALLANPAWQGKTVVMVWEHKHIANAKLAAKSSGEAVTLRQLLQLDKLKDVPETWPAANYDYFWIVDYAGGSATPTGFRMVKQAFGGRYAKLPTNDWGAPNGLTSDSECDLKGAE